MFKRYFIFCIFVFVLGCGSDQPEDSSIKTVKAKLEDTTSAITVLDAHTAPTESSAEPVPAEAKTGLCVEENKYRALFTAVQIGDVEQAKCLIEKGANINQRIDIHDQSRNIVADDTGFSFLCGAIRFNQPDMIKFLVSKGALVNDICSAEEDKDSIYLIHFAAGAATEVALIALIDSGADINKQMVDGVTPVMVAVVENKLANVRLLISRGADFGLQTTDSARVNAYEIAQHYKYQPIADYLLSVCKELGDMGKCYGTSPTPSPHN